MLTEILEQHHAAIESLRPQWPVLYRMAQTMYGCMASEGTVYLCGNGGSAADCQHIAAELVGRFGLERPGLPAIALTTDTSILTAVGNDYGYTQVFKRQVQAFLKPDDVLVCDNDHSFPRGTLARTNMGLGCPHCGTVNWGLEQEVEKAPATPAGEVECKFGHAVAIADVIQSPLAGGHLGLLIAIAQVLSGLTKDQKGDEEDIVYHEPQPRAECLKIWSQLTVEEQNSLITLTLNPQAGVNVFLGKLLKLALCCLVVLHENIIPYLNPSLVIRVELFRGL